ncbi:LPXTG cell wall anchor domain-containing protein [Leucobacter japonicus]|uniref:LPXTG cell wall anchor domain-containing protein n=1 Tax=Leucobacter japonicus TaxID=1461259 RepID=UPI00138F662A|nr:LPXTG cell wall anchor domain-containing protein [Leucobacter japonicus]
MSLSRTAPRIDRVIGRLAAASGPQRAMRSSGAGSNRLVGSAVVVGLALTGIALPWSSTAARAVDATIGGIVREGDTVLDRVEVSAYRWDDGVGAYVFEQETESDASGAWQLGFLPDGAYTLDFATDVSNARFALGESLGGNADYTDDSPEFTIADGATNDGAFADVSLTRLGGEAVLRVVEGDDTLIDLDDAAAQLRGIDAAGASVTSARVFADADGTVTIPRIPSGGYVPWVAARGSDFAPSTTDALIFSQDHIDFGDLELGTGPEATLEAAPPTLSGDARVGAVLTVIDPEFAAAPDSISHHWSADAVALEHASTELALTDAHAGATVSAWVFAHAATSVPYIGVVSSPPVAPSTSGAADAGSDADSANATADADAAVDGGSGSAGAATAASDAGAAASSNAAGAGSRGADGSSDGRGSGSDGHGTLPLTGGAVAATALLGAALIAVGALVFLRRRRVRRVEESA